MERKAVQICNEVEKLTSDLRIEKGGIYAELGKITVISIGTSNEFEEGTILSFTFFKIVAKLNY